MSYETPRFIELPVEEKLNMGAEMVQAELQSGGRNVRQIRKGPHASNNFVFILRSKYKTNGRYGSQL